jgi:hypothetical protein
MVQDSRPPSFRVIIAHVVAAIVIAMLVLAQPVLLRKFERPVADATRYIDSALELRDHGLFSGSRETGTTKRFGLVTGGPLIAFELAAIFALDSALEASMRCSIQPEQSSCPLKLRSLYAAHWLELVLFCTCAWIAAWMIFRRLDAAWLTLLLVVFCRELREGTEQALSEPLAFAIGGIFFLGWIHAVRSGRWQAWLVAGLLLGLLILAKPSATAIIPAAIIAMLLMLFVGRNNSGVGLNATAANALMFVAGTAAATLPLVLRNFIELGVLALSSSAYLSATFAHRIAYNAMSWTEWLAGWLYYLPDFGDLLARKWLPVAAYDRLGWDPQGYYVFGRDILYPQAVTAAGNQASDYMFKQYVLADPIKHAVVTMLMAWRGMFVGKLWGLAAWLVLPAALVIAGPRRLMLVWMLVPGLVLLVGLAAVSVSIPRYNGLLVLPLALGVTALVITLWDSWRRRNAAG